MFKIRFFTAGNPGNVAVCNRHLVANDGQTMRQRWPVETFNGTREQAESYVAKVAAQWFGGVRGEITPA